jgi:hypothetical protein
MEYKIGQAVIYDTPYERNCLGFSLSGATLWTLEGEEIETPIYKARPATEAEILLEIQKHGWVLSHSNRYSTNEYFFVITKNKELWTWQDIGCPVQDELKEYCQEGLQAQTIITALNLSNEKPV